MKNLPRRTNRRRFHGTTSAAAAGLTLMPGSVILFPGAKINFSTLEQYISEVIKIST